MSKRRIRSFLAIALWCGAMGAAVADQAPPAPRPSTEDEDVQDLLKLLNTRIISASKIGQTAMETPSVVEVITRQQIDQYGWTSLNDILYKQPGFGPAQDYDRRTVASRGVWESWLNNHLLLLVDGIPMNENAYGSALTSEITPLFMVKNVEILRGPGSALYGSNATNGVITVNTPSPEDLEKGGEAHVRLGDDGARLYEWIGGFKSDRLFSVVAGYAAQSTPGNEVTDFDGSGRGVDPSGVGALQRFRTNDHRSNWYAWLKLEGEKSLRGLTIQVHDQSWNFQTGYGWAFWIPDQREQLGEERKAVSASYRPLPTGPLEQEYVLRWQAHRFSWNMRYYPNGAFDGYYPAGAWEYVGSTVRDLFGRAQFGRVLRSSSKILFGVETDRFLYSGDHAHNANFDPDTGAPNPNGRFLSLGPWMDTVKDHPQTNVAPYAQFSSGQLFGDKIRITAGARYDHSDLVIDPAVARLYLGSGRFHETKSFSKFSPRLALVLIPQENLSVKLMFGEAFRAPSLAEIGGAHTLSLGSDPIKLRPETVRTTELAFDWRIRNFLNWRTNVFQTTYADFISASSENLNFSANVFTLKNRGLESELLIGHRGISGFFNYAYARRVGERILDPLVAASNEVTWEPSHKANAGMIYSRAGMSVSLSGHYEGRVLRRNSEVGVRTLILGVDKILDLDRYRPRALASWVTLDGKTTYTLPWQSGAVGLFAGGTNLMATRRNVLAKVGPFPFDYPQERRRLYAGLNLRY